jgi:hypothetical protein
MKEIVVSVRDDDQEPGDRVVTFTLKLVSGNVRVGEPSNAQLEINRPFSKHDRDRMGGKISFYKEQISTDAQSKQVRLIVTRDDFTKGAVTVEYQSHDGSARSGVDYSPVAGKLTWEESDNTFRTIEIPLIANSQPAADANFTVSLKNATNGAQIVSPDTASITITRLPASNGQTTASTSNPSAAPDEELSPPPTPPTAPSSREVECRYLRIIPDKIEVGSGRQVEFQATAVYSDGSETDVTAAAIWRATSGTAAQVSPRRTWLLSPGSTFTAPDNLRDNENVTISATWNNCEGKATLNALAPSWTPPMSSASDLGMRGETPGPLDFNHYVLCDKTGHVVTGTSTNLIEFGLMAGPIGARHARQWIDQNCPNALCTIEGQYGLCAKEPPLAATGGDAYYALCDKFGHVVISQAANLTGHVRLSPALTGEAGVRWWIEKNCPSWECTSSGTCASAGQIRLGGKWAVVCNKQSGSIGYTEHPNFVDSWIKVEHLLSDRDAINWITLNCPSERCDQTGRCLPGAAARGRPTEVPPEAVLEMFSQRESSRHQGGYGGAFITGGPRPGRYSATELPEDVGGPATDRGAAHRAEPATSTSAQTNTGVIPGTGTKTVPVTPVKPATPTTNTPSKPPAVPTGTYEPKGSGQPCLQVGQQMEARCRQMSEDCNRRNCSGGGYSGCALDCPGCGGYFGDYVAWCPLHPSYESKVSAGLASFVSQIKTCIDQFLSDGKPGRRERGAECQGKAQKKLAESKDAWVQQACQARCTQDGRSGVAVLGGGRHRCECR